ncbi:hypothetical protein GCM10010176_037890 [Nonomuraea spiralis]|nr:hypothetical protein GCM10010176_037890 [Nonomuraea spiralis]
MHHDQPRTAAVRLLGGPQQRGLAVTGAVDPDHDTTIVHALILGPPYPCAERPKVPPFVTFAPDAVRAGAWRLERAGGVAVPVYGRAVRQD